MCFPMFISCGKTRIIVKKVKREGKARGEKVKEEKDEEKGNGKE